MPWITAMTIRSLENGAQNLGSMVMAAAVRRGICRLYAIGGQLKQEQAA
jgi:hypothetical protein